MGPTQRAGRGSPASSDGGHTLLARRRGGRGSAINTGQAPTPVPGPCALTLPLSSPWDLAPRPVFTQTRSGSEPHTQGQASHAEAVRTLSGPEALPRMGRMRRLPACLLTRGGWQGLECAESPSGALVCPCRHPFSSHFPKEAGLGVLRLMSGLGWGNPCSKCGLRINVHSARKLSQIEPFCSHCKAHSLSGGGGLSRGDTATYPPAWEAVEGNDPACGFRGTSSSPGWGWEQASGKGRPWAGEV